MNRIDLFCLFICLLWFLLIIVAVRGGKIKDEEKGRDDDSVEIC